MKKILSRWADNDADLNDQFRTFSREQSTFHLTSVIMGGLIEARDYQLVWTVDVDMDMEQRWPGLKLEIDLLLREAAVQSTPHIFTVQIL